MRLPNDLDAPRAVELRVFFDGDMLEHHLVQAEGPQQRVRIALPNDDEAAWIELRSRPCLHALRCTLQDQRMLALSAGEHVLANEGALRVEAVSAAPHARLPSPRRSWAERIALAILSPIIAVLALLPLALFLVACFSLISSSGDRDPIRSLVLSDGMRRVRWESLHRPPVDPPQHASARTMRPKSASQALVKALSKASAASAATTGTANGPNVANAKATAIASADAETPDAAARAVVASIVAPAGFLAKTSAPRSGPFDNVVLDEEAAKVLGVLAGSVRAGEAASLSGDAYVVHHDRDAETEATSGSEGGGSASPLALSKVAHESGAGGGGGGAPGTATIGDDNAGDDTIGLDSFGTRSSDGGYGTGDDEGYGSGYGEGGSRCLMTATRCPRAVPVCTIRGCSLQVFGALDKSMIRRVVRAHENEVRNCYERGLEHDRHLAGRVSVDFRIAPSGEVPLSSVYSVDLGADSVEARDVGACIASAVGSWRFQRNARHVGAVVVRYPFMLTPSLEAQALLR
jgi:hypothetical protein